MGSLFGTSAPAAPPPAPPTYVRDELNNVEQVPVTNADGSITYVTRAIPLTAEEQAEQDALDSIMTEAMGEIERLSSSDYADDDETKSILNAWEDEKKNLLDNVYSKRSHTEEAELARRGLADSTASFNVRRQRQLDQQDSLTSLDREKDSLSDSIRSERIGLQQNLYNLAAAQQDSTVARQQQSAINGQSILAASNNARQASLNDYYMYQLKQSQQPSLFSNVANTALSGAGLSFGSSVVSGLSKSLFRS